MNTDGTAAEAAREAQTARRIRAKNHVIDAARELLTILESLPVGAYSERLAEQVDALRASIVTHDQACEPTKPLF